MRIGFIGTGVMGRPMALHLAEAGHELKVYNRSYAKAKALEPKVQAVTSVAEAVRDAEAVFSIVGFVRDVEETYLGPNGVLANCPSSCTVCDMTTSSPDLAKRIADKAAARGVMALDAPVTGGEKGAIEGSLSIMVGGPEEAFQRLKPCLELMGATLTYMGGSGCGQHAKLANQLSIAAALAGTAESLSYAAKHGLNLDAMLNVIVHGSAASWQAQNMGPKMIRGDYAPGFFIKHLIKDLNLGQEAREDLNLPVGAAVLEILRGLQAAGYGDEGTQAIIRAYGSLT